MVRKLDGYDNKKNEIKGFLFHSIIMLILVIIVYWQYLAGHKLYVFTDVASDSVGQAYPNLVYLAREISHGNIGNRWNFMSSIGNAADMIWPKLSNIEAFFGTDHVAYLMGLEFWRTGFTFRVFFFFFF